MSNILKDLKETWKFSTTSWKKDLSPETVNRIEVQMASDKLLQKRSGCSLIMIIAAGIILAVFILALL